VGDLSKKKSVGSYISLGFDAGAFWVIVSQKAAVFAI